MQSNDEAHLLLTLISATLGITLALVVTVICCCRRHRSRCDSEDDEERQHLLAPERNCAKQRTADVRHVAVMINAIESQGLKTEGLYRVGGSEKVFNELRLKLFSETDWPTSDSLNGVEDFMICRLLKEYFRRLEEPLIPLYLRPRFVTAANLETQEAMNAALHQLPHNNLAVLTLLCLHLQRVSRSERTRMSCDNLGRMLSPAVLGQTSLDLEYLKQDALVMQKLVELPTDYWIRMQHNSSDV